MDLQTAWYLVIAASVLLYTVLDGFDLGVGSLHLFARTDEQRRVFLNSIGPVWDGNEVWIVIVMGGLLAGFPDAYATIFSGFYTLLMVLIASFIFRAVSIEFRSKRESRVWRQTWDWLFCVASMLVAFVIGLILGNLIEGVPLDAAQNYSGSFSDFVRPYSILVGLLAIALFSMHGAIYLYMKTEGEAHEVVRRWINPAISVFVFFFFAVTGATLLTQPKMIDPFRANHWFSIVPLLALGAIFTIPYQVRKERGGWAFIFSCISIFLLLVLFHIGNFPVLLHSTIDPANHLTIYNSAASDRTLVNLLIVVAIGLPLVFAYGFLIYRIFRGKVRLDSSSY